MAPRGNSNLAAQFETCLKALDNFGSNLNFETDLPHRASDFEAAKLDFKNWCQAISLEQGMVSDDRHKVLDDPQTRSTIEKILFAIEDIENPAVYTFQYTKAAEFGSSENVLLSRSQIPDTFASSTSGAAESKWQRLKRTLRIQARRVTQVEQFERLVQSLHDLVPPNGAKGIRSVHRGPMASTGRLDSAQPHHAPTKTR